MGLSLQRRIGLGLLAALSATVAIAMPLHSFLAVDAPIGNGILVVEAWIPREALASVPQIFESGRYLRVVTVGGPVGADAAETYADVAADELARAGLAPEMVTILRVASGEPSHSQSPLPDAGLQVSGRTYASGLAVRQWLEESGTSVDCVDVVTIGVHARKSRVLFQHALAGYRVGVVAVQEVDYDPRFWVLSARGIWIVGRNLCGYIYAKLQVEFGTRVGQEPFSSNQTQLELRCEAV
jgi:hypothetical protein